MSSVLHVHCANSGTSGNKKIVHKAQHQAVKKNRSTVLVDYCRLEAVENYYKFAGAVVISVDIELENVLSGIAHH